MWRAAWVLLALWVLSVLWFWSRLFSLGLEPPQVPAVQAAVLGADAPPSTRPYDGQRAQPAEEKQP